ncbi:hypothetical protein [Nostoc sphaeroides]|uniref:Uncharacterized protein n=1 Tax=Nostoc sphaeroides CCNUC1 TaxID=2653204 RepID=A0A5P8WFD2_9NOSO|nr:hypothetical protein [Nostoc sphaeroides]QFS51384.1 hypothetical protein GXM_08878 [Nostoc sphaeroides CCNUC1]
MDFRKFYIPTVIAGLAILTSANQALAQARTDLTGTWVCDQNAPNPFYIRQVDSELWGIQDGGFTFTNAFHGTNLGGSISGTWADVPKAVFRQYGTVSGKVDSYNQITLYFTFANAGGQVTKFTCNR